ncbi:MAG: PEP-CTERM sorting domain-containing protein [Planctomycetota bacterium]
MAWAFITSTGLAAPTLASAEVILTANQDLSGRAFLNPLQSAPGDQGFSFLQAALNTYSPGEFVTVGDTEGTGAGRFGMGYVMSFTITQEFFDIISAGGTSTLTIDSASPINGGAPSPVNLSIIARNATQSFGNTNVGGAWNPNVFSEDVLVSNSVPAGTPNQIYDVSLWFNPANLVVGENAWFALWSDNTNSDNATSNFTQFGLNPALTATPIPEPASLTLIGLGGLLLARRRRRV